jgi:hypothetical protein
MPQYRVICEWEGDLTIDADQITVYADSAESAMEKARKKWRLTIGSQWPDCKLGQVFIVPSSASTKLT